MEHRNVGKNLSARGESHQETALVQCAWIRLQSLTQKTGTQTTTLFQRLAV